jgi:CheY-like chemotaxis protein
MSRNLRVLLVEDHEDAREALKLILECWAHSVDTAPDGSRGLQLGITGRYDVVICDLHLPHLDGFEIGRRLSRLTPRPYLIAYTAFAREQDRMRSDQAGFDIHLAKGSPASLDKLRSLLKGL